MGFVVEKVWAFIATGDDGDEGVLSHLVMDLEIMEKVNTPLIGADKARMDSYRPLAMQIGKRLGREVRLVEFSTKKIIEIIKEVG